MKKITIISPVFNEESVIKVFFNALKETLDSIENNYIFEILFVVDKSSDKTFEIITEIAKENNNVKAILLSRRFGHQMSLVAGMDQVKDGAIIMMDSDLQHPPNVILEMIDKYEKGFEIVYTIRTSTEKQNLIRSTMSKIFYYLLNRISDINIGIGEADYRLISPKVVNIFQNQIRERNQFLRGLFKWVGFKSVSVNFKANERVAGKTKYSFNTMIKFASSGLTSFSRKPLQYSIYLGVILSLLSFGIGIHSFISYFLNNVTPSGWTTLTILISLFSGIQLLFLGVIGEYIGSIFEEVKQRPLYIIEDKINIK
tara:strand:+ start:108 stop:1046 length:939 start_codon:yes stop_codon:yes gene_type:complete